MADEQMVSLSLTKLEAVLMFNAVGLAAAVVNREAGPLAVSMADTLEDFDRIGHEGYRTLLRKMAASVKDTDLDFSHVAGPELEGIDNAKH